MPPTPAPAPGLINSQLPPVANVTGATAPAAAPVQAAAAPPAVQATNERSTAATVNMDPATQTVQGQLASILSSGNPLLVQAQTRAAQGMNRRGLVNSSMAIGAGESALYDAAMPIASADAGTYQQNALANAEFSQQTGQFNAGETNTTNRFNAGEANTTGRLNSTEENRVNLANQSEAGTTNRFNTQQTNEVRRANAAAQNEAYLAGFDRATRTELLDIEAGYKTLMQASDSASSLYQQSLKNIADITSNPDLDGPAKQAAINQQKAYLQNGMNLIASMNNLNVSKLVDFSGSQFNYGKPAPAPAPKAPTSPVPTSQQGDA